MKLLYILHTISNYGGLARTICHQANELVCRFGFDITVVTFNDMHNDGFDLNPKIHRVKLNYPIFGASLTKRLSNTLRLRRSLMALIKTERPDITITLQNIKETGWISGYAPAGKTIVESHSNYAAQLPTDGGLLRKISNLFVRRLVKRSDRFVVLTQRDVESYSHIRKADYISNAVPFTTRRRADYSAKRVVAVGRIDVLKNLGDLVDIWAHIHRGFPQWKLRICGDGPEKEALLAQINVLGLTDSIEVGYTSDVKEEYLSSSVMAMTSKQEGMPMVLLEAASCGLPCIAFDCDNGPSEAIDDGKTGFVIPKWDKTMFANRLRELMADEELRRKIGEAAVEKMEREYSDDVIMNKWNELILSLNSMKKSAKKSLLFRLARGLNRKRIKIKNHLKYICRKKTIAELKSLLPGDVSIISSNCFAGRIYQDFHKPYLSPTAGLFFTAEDFNEFCRHVRHYTTDAQLTFASVSKNPKVNARRQKYNLSYPIGLLDNKIELHFLLFKSENEAKTKWTRRCERINYDNIMFIGMEQNYCSIQDIIDFQNLSSDVSYKSKFFFSTKYIPEATANIPMRMYENEIGNAFDDCKLFYKELIKRFK